MQISDLSRSAFTKSLAYCIAARAAALKLSYRCSPSAYQHVVAVAVQWREQIIEDAALAGHDLGDDRHPGRQLERFAVDDEALLIEGDARGIDQLMGMLDIRRLVARGLRAVTARALRLRLVDRVVRDALDPAVDQPLAGERKGVDPDFSLLADLDKADILIGDHRIDLDLPVRRHNAQQLLGRRHDVPQDMHRQILHHAGNRRGEDQARSSSWTQEEVRPATYPLPSLPKWMRSSSSRASPKEPESVLD
jgi:hypothetical protein